jgi:hypothetical protein
LYEIVPEPPEADCPLVILFGLKDALVVQLSFPKIYPAEGHWAIQEKGIINV